MKKREARVGTWRHPRVGHGGPPRLEGVLCDRHVVESNVLARSGEEAQDKLINTENNNK